MNSVGEDAFDAITPDVHQTDWVFLRRRLCRKKTGFKKDTAVYFWVFETKNGYEGRLAEAS